MKKTLPLLALVLFASLTAQAASPERWLHVRVEESGPNAENVRVNVPLSLAEKVLPSIQAEHIDHGKLTLEEVSGGTFTVSNLGMYGVDGFTPILNTPQTGILGVGRIVEKPVIYRGEIAKRSMMVLSLTFDHRVIDGAPAGAFLQTVADLLAHGNRISLDVR